MDPLNVFLVSSSGQCGIAEYGAQLIEAIPPNTGIHIRENAGSLDPKWMFSQTLAPLPQILHLNYHAALHSQWTPDWVRRWQELPIPGGAKVVVTYHDSGVPNSQQCLDLYAVADAFVVHEPCEDLPNAKFWRQGIPDWSTPCKFASRYGAGDDPFCFKAAMDQPVVGSVGFPFGWKNFDLLAEGSAAAGWALLLIAPGASDEDIARWTALNPWTTVWREFQTRTMIGSLLAGCDATAFLYNCHNTGTSGAIRQGIAARKPVIATRFPAGRQFRDLQEDHPLGKRVITWIEPSLHAVTETLARVPIAPLHAGMVHLAERDSWANVGKKYAQLYRELTNA